MWREERRLSEDRGRCAMRDGVRRRALTASVWEGDGAWQTGGWNMRALETRTFGLNPRKWEP